MEKGIIAKLVDGKLVYPSDEEIKNDKLESYTFFDEGTNEKVMEILERSRINDERIRLFFGDKETGRCWHETFDVLGRVGRSTGSHKIPLLIKSVRSSGGGAILTACIVAITKDKEFIYKHPGFKLNVGYKKTDNSEYPYSVYDKDTEAVIVNTKNEKSAIKSVNFYRGTANQY